MRFSTKLHHTSITLALAAAFATLAPSAQAATSTANLGVSASVAANCTISTTPVAFGAYDPVVANATSDLNGSGSVSVACTKGASGLSVGLGNGLNFSASRRMTNGTDFLAYGLFQPPNNTPGTACTFPASTAWGNTVGTNTLALTNATSKNSRTYNVCGTVSAGQDVAVGSYADTVVATINF
jgi:spore coat protein U-like protein